MKLTIFRLLQPKHKLLLLAPAVLASLISGGIAPFMTYVVGKTFDAFASYPLTKTPTEDDNARLLRNVGIASLELLALGVASMAMASLTSFLWIWTGEVNVLALRRKVFLAVRAKEMAWYDRNVDGGRGDESAAGLMAKFARETDDVRSASSLAAGMLLQCLTTTLACFILAFQRSYALTFVILSSLPILTLLQAFSQALAHPLLTSERTLTSIAASTIERAISAITTVKSFNAQSIEADRAQRAFVDLDRAANKLNTLWCITSGSSQFVVMAMFVQAFWFGAKLVREGKVSLGDVLAVFWACLIATSNLQMCIPKWIVFAKGKFALVRLLNLVEEEEGDEDQQRNMASIVGSTYGSPPTSPTTMTTRKASRVLRKITPQRCLGEMALHSVTFSYPSSGSAADTPRNILSSVSLFIPANELTFIVGTSGSGKSTVAQLLLGLYPPQRGGQVTIDEQDMRYLEPDWVRENIMGLGQAVGGAGCVILEGASIFENVAVAAEKDVDKGAVEDACRAALLHEFIRDLPDGYDTVLGGDKGVQLSGGQKQRLGIARAKLRDAPVLILDEATSSLDPISRLLVFTALKTWRRNKTTIVITHELTQIESSDFVYVMKDGKVVEQGFRYDLESGGGSGEFRRMAEVGVGGEVEREPEEEPEQLVPDIVDEETDGRLKVPAALEHQSFAIRPLTFGNWMFDAIAELTASAAPVNAEKRMNTAPFPTEATTQELRPQLKLVIPPLPSQRKRRPSSVMGPCSPVSTVEPTAVCSPRGGRFSLPPVTPTSATFTIVDRDFENDGYCDTICEKEREEEAEFGKAKAAMTKSGSVVYHTRTERRAQGKGRWKHNTDDKLSVTIAQQTPSALQPQPSQPPSFWRVSLQTLPTIASIPSLIFGLLLCILSGLMTPVFSFLLSRLLFEVSLGGTRTHFINQYGVIVLGIAALDGIFLSAKFFLMERVAGSTVLQRRSRAFTSVLAQDQTWFDTNSAGSPALLVQRIVKDGDDARMLISVVWGQCFVVIAMLGAGLLWALVWGWQLTLAGLAIVPVSAFIMAFQSRLVGSAEERNKAAREHVAKSYYETILHARGVRVLGGRGIQAWFDGRFEDAAVKAMKAGIRGALAEGCTYGVATGLVYAAEGMLFYVGAVLIAKGIFTYLQMIQVLNLVVFSVTIGSQLMAFTEKISRSTIATHSLSALTSLPTQGDQNSESKGTLQPPSLLSPDATGPLVFSNVSFAYPSNPTARVLKGLNMKIFPGECVAVVGPSGCGKSTIVGLLQRLWEPLEGGGAIYASLDTRSVESPPTLVNLNEIQTNHLRSKLSLVSQCPRLFPGESIASNIRYGSKPDSMSDEAVVEAAKAANVHEMIVGGRIKGGYDGRIGEEEQGGTGSGSLSGGEMQRLQIARAIAKLQLPAPDGAELLILDECTSALDGENEAKVMDAIRGIVTNNNNNDDDDDDDDSRKTSRKTVLVITHKIPVMQLCDRIIVLDQGSVCEEGTFETLTRRRGTFASLVSGGEFLG